MQVAIIPTRLAIAINIVYLVHPHSLFVFSLNTVPVQSKMSKRKSTDSSALPPAKKGRVISY